MRSVVLIGGLWAGLCLASPLAAQPPASKPAELTAGDPETLGLWFRSHVARAPQWHVRSYTADGLVMTNRTIREGLDGHVKGEVRVERTLLQELEGFSWRSAMLTSDVDCAGSIAVSRYSDQAGRSVIQAPQPDPRQTKLTVYEGQNLTGQSRSFDVEPGTFPPGPMGQALRDICNLATADRLDQGLATQGMLLAGRDKESMASWAKALDSTDWEAPTVGAADATFRSRKVTRNGQKVRLTIRTELVEPVLTNSILRAADAVRGGDNRRETLRPVTRPMWVRSQSTEYEFDCQAVTVRTLALKQFEMRGLRHAASDLKLDTPPSRVAPTSTYTPLLQAACGASAPNR